MTLRAEPMGTLLTMAVIRREPGIRPGVPRRTCVHALLSAGHLEDGSGLG